MTTEGTRTSATRGISAWIGFAGGMLALAIVASSASADSIRWKSGTITLERQGPAQIEAALQVVPETRGRATRHVVVQFDRPVDDALRTTLADNGMELLNYVGSDAYFAVVGGERLQAGLLSRVSAVRHVTGIDATWKVHTAWLDGVTPEWAVVDVASDGTPVVVVYVLFHPDIDLTGEGLDVAEAYGAEVLGLLESINGAVIALPQDLILALGGDDAVQWVDMPLPKMESINDGARARTGADIVQAPPYDLDGSGVTVLVFDAGTARATHVDFQGRLTVYDSSGMSSHPTHVSGTIGGAGVADPAYRGMAPGVTLLSYGLEQEGGLHEGFLYTDPCDLEDDYDEAINVHGADISNNSIGTNTASNGFPCDWEGDYGVTDVLIDTIVRGDGSNPLFTEPFRIVWANGNERGNGRCGTEYHTTAPPACAKNHITVGALDDSTDTISSFSSWGPADDDRMKPDISAPGVSIVSCTSSGDTAYTTMSGTSMASPTTCGCSALLMEDFRTQFPGLPDFRNSTLKILLAHTAVDRGNLGPDYQYGYGSIRVNEAVDFLRSENFLEGSVGQGQVFAVRAIVGASDTELKVTLAWDDYPGTPNVSPALVNDLDLRVYNPSDVRVYPWTLGGLANPSVPAVRTAENHVDNIEQVYVGTSDPAWETGIWRVEIYGYAVPQGPQPFSVCASPELLACSSMGRVDLDAPLYGCTALAEVRVIDCDLNTDDLVIETTTVNVASDSEPAGETVILVETAPESADFRGTIPFDTIDSAGVLLVSDGETVTATYIDADDGQGHYNVVVTDTASLDCQPPLISNVQIAAIAGESAIVTFDTDESASCTVRYGLDCGSLTDSQAETGSGTTHAIGLTGLSPGTRYDFVIDAVDMQDNAGTDDNGGQCYSFATLDIIHSFPLDTNPGWTTTGQWAFGQPTGGGSYNGDPTSGHTGSNVYGYNLNGDYANNLPATYLTTTALDCSGAVSTKLTFWRWLGVESNSNFDEATVEVSNNGSDWTVVYRATDTGADVADTSWQFKEYEISSIADGQPTVYVRWGMGPTDGGLTYPGWNIDDIQILAAGGVLAISYPDGLPALLTPAGPTSFTVRIVEGDEQYVPGSGLIHYRYYGGSYQSAPLAPLGGDLYEATLPAANCNATPEFYITAEGTQSGVVIDPPSAPSSAYTAGVGTLTVIMDDDFESDLGWTTEVLGATSGAWERGVPVNDPDWQYDPAADSDGSGQCYLTENQTGNTDVDAGAVRLATPVLDISAGGDVSISYDYFLRLTNAGERVDMLLVEISSNGDAGPWTEIARHDTDGGLSWRSHEITPAELAGFTMTDNVKIRFTANDADSQSIVEGGLDAVLITSFSCEGFVDCNQNGIPDDEDISSGTSTDVNGTGIPDECETVGDMDCDGETDFGDINPFVTALVEGEAAYYSQYPDCDWYNADCDGDGEVDFGDINPFVELMLH